MADPFWIDPEAEEQVLLEANRLRAEFRRAQEMVRANPDIAYRAVANTQAAPWATPGTVTGTAMAGVEGEQFMQIAMMDDGGEANLFSRAVGRITGAVDDIGESLWEQAVKPVVRGAFLVFDTAFQELVERPFVAATEAFDTALKQDDGPTFGEAYRDMGNSAGVIAARELLQAGRDPNRTVFGTLTQADDLSTEGTDESFLGTGFFAGGQVGAEAEAQRTLTIDGQRAGFGVATPMARLTAELVGEGSKAHDVVAGLTQFAAEVFLDPATLATGGSKTVAEVARKAGASENLAHILEVGAWGKYVNEPRQFSVPKANGLIQTSRQSTVLPDAARQFFREKELLTKIAESDAHTLAQSFRRSRANHVDSALLGRLGAATDEKEVAEILLEQIAYGNLKQRGLLNGLGARTGVRPWMRAQSIAGISTRGLISPSNLDDAAAKIDTYLRQAKVDEAKRATIFNQIADMAAKGDDSYQGLKNITREAMDYVGETLGAAADDIRELTSLREGYMTEFRRFGHDELGKVIRTPFIKEGERLPQITSELAELAFELPDVRHVRRAVNSNSKLKSIYNTQLWTVPVDSMAYVTRRLFKPAAILRPAYIIRIGFEEQARLAAAGMDSAINHPFRWIMSNVLNKDAAADLMGGSFKQKAKALAVMSRDATGLLADHLRARTHLWDIMPKPPDRVGKKFANAWRHELAQMASADEVRALVARNGDLDGWVDWLKTTPEGKEVLSKIGKVNDESSVMIGNDVLLKQWGRSIWKRVEAKTKLDAELLDLITDAEWAADPNRWGGVTKKLLAKDDVAPAFVKVEAVTHDPEKLRSTADRALDFMFHHITGKPTSELARYPAFRQFMIKDVNRLMESLESDDLRVEVARRLGDGLNLNKAEQRELARSVARASGSKGILSDIEELNDILVTRAAQQVKDLLFDVTTRSQAQEQLEILVPFLDAWKEVTQTWASLLKENPAFFMRMESGFSAAKSEGVFYTNENGEEVFAYPGGGLVGNMMARSAQAGGGVLNTIGAIPGAIADTVTGRTNPDALPLLEGRVQGLNLVAQGVGPGFGPVIQWMAGTVVPDTEDFRVLREFIAPFGTDINSLSELTSPEDVFGALRPAWADKFWNAWNKGSVDEVQWNSMVGDAMKALATSEAYDYRPDRPGDSEKLLEDAERAARWLLFVRATFQATAPTGPTAKWQLEQKNEGAPPTDWDPEHDPDARWHAIAVYAGEYRRMRETYGDDELASARFLEMYGLEPFYIGQAKTKALRESPVTQEGAAWMAANRDLAGIEHYPRVLGFFAPEDAGADLDYSVYRESIERGDRVSLTGQQQLELANQTKARALYSSVKKRLADAPAKHRQNALGLVSAELDDKFPGWRFGVLGVAGGASTEEKIEELQRAVADPRLAGNPLTGPLSEYFAARERLVAVAQSRGVKTLSNQASEDLRATLFQIGTTIAQRNPEFNAVWSKVLSREVEE